MGRGGNGKGKGKGKDKGKGKSEGSGVVYYEGTEIEGYDVNPDQGPSLGTSRFALWQREVEHEYTRQIWQYEHPETPEGWSFFDDAAHDLLDHMYAENERYEAPVVQELNVHGWTYLLILDTRGILPNAFVHGEHVVGVQFSAHPSSSGKARRIRWV